MTANSLVSLEPQMVGGAEDNGGRGAITGSLPSTEVAGVPPLAAPCTCLWATSTAHVTGFYCRGGWRGRGLWGQTGDTGQGHADVGGKPGHHKGRRKWGRGHRSGSGPHLASDSLYDPHRSLPLSGAQCPHL